MIVSRQPILLTLNLIPWKTHCKCTNIMLYSIAIEQKNALRLIYLTYMYSNFAQTFILGQKKILPASRKDWNSCAQDRTRTDTAVTPPEPETGASTNSATWAFQIFDGKDTEKFVNTRIIPNFFIFFNARKSYLCTWFSIK